MMGTSEPDDCSFVWDENSQLYFHASSGFYHDPVAGWYYSGRDGLYYKFENGNYVLMESEKSGEGEIDQNKETGYDNPSQDETFRCGSNENCHAFQGDECEVYQCIETTPDENRLGDTECSNSSEPENPPPPSEWLEDTLIELYLSGYSKPVVTDSDHVMMPLETDDALPAEGTSDAYELEGEWCPENHCDVTNSSGNVLDEGASWDEENWRAQYGQVIKSGEEPMPEFEVVDLWDWEKVTGTRKDGKGEVVRLVGRLVRRSAKCHPSMPSGGGLLKTAPICEVHLDLRIHVYRDRAAERRTLHGGFGVGPGQKNSKFDEDEQSSSYASANTEEAAAEALNMSFGAGSYARKLLKGMGWKEGEGLGSTTKGMVEPIQAVGNVGNAGLGWPQGIAKHH
ncbi:uncharacterized protein LOC115963168 isoform X4 [Quercus lobata]|uniref:uncharacterized protein LOC115963168 isoform X4 n=1 Tax=Quercus lobata TaxID=97700 RepID=UPI00124435E1|nr:uncharacterized protein LOC115963168 isoform X4 [Quercus lobata]